MRGKRSHPSIDHPEGLHGPGHRLPLRPIFLEPATPGTGETVVLPFTSVLRASPFALYVPLRFEVGPRDVDNNSVFCAKRTGDKKFGIAVDDDFLDRVLSELDGIQSGLLETAIARRDANTHEVDTYQAMKEKLPDGGGFFLVPWHDDAEKEREIKDDCKATIRCFPLDSQDQIEGKVCFYSGRPATHMAIFARAY